MNRQELCKALTEMSSEDLREVNRLAVQLIKDRSRQEGARMMSQLNRGDLVAFNDNVKPTYLRRSTARVISLRQTRLEVELTDGPVGKFRSGIIITAPALVHKVADAKVTPEVSNKYVGPNGEMML